MPIGRPVWKKFLPTWNQELSVKQGRVSQQQTPSVYFHSKLQAGNTISAQRQQIPLGQVLVHGAA